MSKVVRMDYDTWATTFKPMTNYIDPESAFDQTMFETYGDEVEHVCDRANTPDTQHTVWTYIDGDDGTYIIDGYRIVNRIGHFVTEKPADPDTIYEVLVDKYDEHESKVYVYDERNIDDLRKDDVIPVGADISYSYVDEPENKRCGYASFGTYDEANETDSFGVGDDNICFYFESVDEMLETVRTPQEFVIHSYEIHAKDKHEQHAHS